MAINPTLPLSSDPLQLRLTMLSDWHVGSGTGRPGNVDRLVVRDHDGLPYVPAKTLTGMWRDACERLTFGLDGSKRGGWSGWVNYLFGDQPARGETDPSQAPRSAAVSLRSAHLAEALRERLRGDSHRARALQAALTFVKPGVQIDSLNGRALDEHLRFEEMARMGAVLTADFAVILPTQPQQRAAAVALLLASTRLIERLGGKRRRGGGRCQVEVANSDIQAAIAWLADTPDAPDVPAWDGEPATATAHHAVSEPDDTWMSIPFVLELSAPLAVTSRTIGNVIESLDFVPGTLLLPHFTSALRKLDIHDVRSAIASGDLRVLPATVDIDGHAGRPVPLALFQQKETGSLGRPGTLVNRLLQPDAEEQQIKQCRSGYVGAAMSGEMPRHTNVTKILQTHNTVEEQRQRPTTDVGGVYSYEAIRVPRLRSALRLRKELYDRVAQQPAWRETLAGPCALGHSKKDDYGAATLILEGAPHPTAMAAPCHGDKLYVWLLSDVLLRDERLRPTPTPEALRQELERRLGVTLHLDMAQTRARRTESWHTIWGLPRPSLLAMQAGSCVVFTVDSAPTPTALSRIEAEGVGERRGEGYGQVCFNDPLLTTIPSTLQPPPELPTALIGRPDALPVAHAASAFAQHLEAEVWREAIRRKALQVAQEHRNALLGWETAQGQPPMSQLGGLRGVVQQLQTWEEREIVIAWLDHVKATQRRADRWPEGALQKVRRLCERSQTIWEIFQPSDWPTLTEGAVVRLQSALWSLAVRSLIYACIHAHKRALDQVVERRR